MRPITNALGSLVLALGGGFGCGDGVPASRMALELDSKCPRISGSYAGIFTLSGSTGECGNEKQVSYDTLGFDEQGLFISPAAALIACATEQTDCSLEVRCEGLGMLATFFGTLRSDGSYFAGTASLPGRTSGCSRVLYALDATRKEEPGPEEPREP